MEDVNCVPQSEVMVSGTPKWVIQVVMRAEVQLAVVVEVRGAASGQRVVRSMMVRMWVCCGGWVVLCGGWRVGSAVWRRGVLRWAVRLAVWPPGRWRV